MFIQFHIVTDISVPPPLQRRISRPLAEVPPPSYEEALHDPVPDTDLDNEQEVEAAMKLQSVGFKTETLEREGTLPMVDMAEMVCSEIFGWMICLLSSGNIIVSLLLWKHST